LTGEGKYFLGRCRRFSVNLTFTFINYSTAKQDSNAFPRGPLRCLVQPQLLMLPLASIPKVAWALCPSWTDHQN